MIRSAAVPRYRDFVTQPQTLLLAGYTLVYLLTWSLVPLFAHWNIPDDNLEQLAWVLNPDWGYNKHPPFPTWVLWVFERVFPHGIPLTYLLGSLQVAMMLGLAWRLACETLDARCALVAVLLQWVRRGLPASVVAPRAAAPGNLLQRTQAEFGAVLVRPWARVVLVTVFFEGACLYGPFAFIAAHLHQRFDLPLSTVGALVMLFALGSMSYALSARLLVGRLGEVVLVRTGSVFMAAALGVLAWGPTWWWAMPACALLGLGFYMMHNTLQTHATQMAPERRGAAVATFAASLFLGQSLGVGAAGLLVGVVGTGWVLSAGGAGMLLVAWNFNRQRSMRPEAGTSLA